MRKIYWSVNIAKELFWHILTVTTYKQFGLYPGVDATGCGEIFSCVINSANSVNSLGCKPDGNGKFKFLFMLIINLHCAWKSEALEEWWWEGWGISKKG